VSSGKIDNNDGLIDDLFQAVSQMSHKNQAHFGSIIENIRSEDPYQEYLDDEEGQAFRSAFNAEMGTLRDEDASQSWEEFNTDTSLESDEDDTYEPTLIDYAMWDAEQQRDEEISMINRDLDNPFLSHADRKELESDAFQVDLDFRAAMKRIRESGGERRRTKE